MSYKIEVTSPSAYVYIRSVFVNLFCNLLLIHTGLVSAAKLFAKIVTYGCLQENIIANTKLSNLPHSSLSYSLSLGPSSLSETSKATLRANMLATSLKPK